MALDEGNRGTTIFQHDLDRLVVERVALGIAAALAATTFLVIAGSAVQDVFNVLRGTGGFQMLDDSMHFIVGNEGAMDAGRIAGARRQVEHVALAEQRLGAHLVEDGARVDLARHLE